MTAAYVDVGSERMGSRDRRLLLPADSIGHLHPQARRQGRRQLREIADAHHRGCLAQGLQL